jgi:hypothetical protein
MYKDFLSILSKNPPALVMAACIAFVAMLHLYGLASLAAMTVPLALFFIAGASLILGYLQGIAKENTERRRGQSQGYDSGSTDDQMPENFSSASSWNHLQQIRAVWDGTIFRMSKQIDNLGLRANVNLTLGAAISLLGFSVLALYVIYPPADADDWKDKIFHFVVRLSLVGFIEVFAYFFLNLYRTGLSDIKYFQNEMTNATFRFAAVELAFSRASAAEMKGLWEELVKTERNILIKKTETTHELRQMELMLDAEKAHALTLQKLMDSFTQKLTPGK